jgi:hypothetical protein
MPANGVSCFFKASWWFSIYNLAHSHFLINVFLMHRWVDRWMAGWMDG